MQTTLFASLVTTIVVAGCGSMPPSEPASGPAPPAVVAAVMPITTVDLPSYVEAGGTVRARATATVTSRVVAPIREVHVRPGDHVRLGQRLVTLDARALSSQVAQAAAALTAATETSRAATSREAASEAALQLATATHARIASLHEKRSATTQELDQAVAARDTATAQVDAARAERAAAAAARVAAAAAREAATVTESYTVLTAPFDGVVAERMADAGSLAAPGVPLVIVEESGPVRLEVSLDDTRAGSIAVGQQADVRLDQDVAWTRATVVEVGRSDATSHSFLVKLDLPGELSPRTGAFGRARFANATHRALAVPSSSLVRHGQITLVFLVDADGVAHVRPVRLGVVDDGQAEIVAGLVEGDLIVVDPPANLFEGSRVESRPAAAPGGVS